jgi:hypothetical protein
MTTSHESAAGGLEATPVREASRLSFFQRMTPAPSTLRALRATGAPFEIHTDVSGALRRGPGELVMIDLNAISAEDLSRLQQAVLERTLYCRLLFFSREINLPRLAALMAPGLLTNWIAGDLDQNTDDLRVTVQKILRDDLLGIEKYFGWGVQLKRFELTRSEERFSVLREAERLAAYHNVHHRFVSMFSTVAEELITNAFFNGPVNPDGTPRHRQLGRDEAVTLAAGEKIVVSLATDGRRLAVSVADPFGSLDKERLLSKLGSQLGSHQRELSLETGGAGLGITLLFESLSQMVVNLCPHQWTEIIGIMNCGGTYREFLTQKKSFNLFVRRAIDQVSCD